MADTQDYKATFKYFGTDIGIYIFNCDMDNKKVNLFNVFNNFAKVANNNNDYKYSTKIIKGKNEDTISQVFLFLELIGFIQNANKKVSGKKITYKFSVKKTVKDFISKKQEALKNNVSEHQIKSELMTFILEKLIYKRLNNINKKQNEERNLKDSDKKFINLVCSIYYFWKSNLLIEELKLDKNTEDRTRMLLSKISINYESKSNPIYWKTGYQKFVMEFCNEHNELISQIFEYIKDYFLDYRIEDNLERIKKIFSKNSKLITERINDNNKFDIEQIDEKTKDNIFINKDIKVFPLVFKFNQFINFLQYAKLHIPEYQRKYKWGNKNNLILINGLLEDIKKSKTTEPIILGTILLAAFSEEIPHYLEIIDGQQRLTTLSIIYIAMIKYADINEFNDEIFKPVMLKKFKFANNNEDKKSIYDTKIFNEICTYDFSNLMTKENAYSNAYCETIFWLFEQNFNEKQLKQFMNSFLNKILFVANFYKPPKENSKYLFEVFLNANTKKEELKVWEIFETNILLKAIELDTKNKNDNNECKTLAINKLHGNDGIKSIMRCKNDENNDKINDLFTKYFEGYRQIFDKKYEKWSSNQIMQSLNDDLEWYLENHENKTVLDYLDHLIRYFKILDVFYNFKSNMQDETLKYVNDFVYTFSSKTALIPFMIRILDIFSDEETLTFYKEDKNLDKINRARNILFLLEAYYIHKELNYNATSLYKHINDQINFKSKEDCSNQNVIRKLFNKKNINIDNDVIRTMIEKNKEHGIRNVSVLLYRIAYYLKHRDSSEMIKIDLERSSIENWTVQNNAKKLTIEHMISQSNYEKASEDNQEEIYNLIHDFGNLVPYGEKANKSNSDSPLFKKITNLYTKHRDLTMIDEFNGEWEEIKDEIVNIYLKKEGINHSFTTNEYENNKGNKNWRKWTEIFANEKDDLEHIKLYKKYIDARRNKYIDILINIYVKTLQKMISDVEKLTPKTYNKNQPI